jgi:hypothetical protein
VARCAQGAAQRGVWPGLGAQSPSAVLCGAALAGWKPRRGWRTDSRPPGRDWVGPAHCRRIADRDEADDELAAVPHGVVHLCCETSIFTGFELRSTDVTV